MVLNVKGTLSQKAIVLSVKGPGDSRSLTRRNEQKVMTKRAASKHDPSPKFRHCTVPLWWGGQRGSQSPSSFFKSMCQFDVPATDAS